MDCACRMRCLGSAIPRLRPEVEWFAEELDKKAYHQDYANGIGGVSLKYLAANALERLAKLQFALLDGKNQEAMKEAIEIAYYCMAIAHFEKTIIDGFSATMAPKT